jgi:hypothetical protein
MHRVGASSSPRHGPAQAATERNRPASRAARAVKRASMPRRYPTARRPRSRRKPGQPRKFLISSYRQ